ncbi:hypothetical protein GVAV_000616 [Gurleya vavrai]
MYFFEELSGIFKYKTINYFKQNCHLECYFMYDFYNSYFEDFFLLMNNLEVEPMENETSALGIHRYEPYGHFKSDNILIDYKFDAHFYRCW